MGAHNRIAGADPAILIKEQIALRDTIAIVSLTHVCM